MSDNPTYPSADIARDASGAAAPKGALIVDVEEGTPADDAGFEPGCYLTAVDGQPLRDVIDWRWLSSGEEMRVGYIDLDGDEGEVDLWREPGESWGFEFDGLVFDEVRQCRNGCTFCFMHQLPRGMRRSLYLRDDDFRLSFLVGTFVTLTNMTPEDEARIVEQRISPLRVSLQVVNPQVRRRLIGKHAQHGIDSLERLLAAGIEFHAQIVLVPGENDGNVLRDSLEWAYARPGILGVGIVPLGYTRHQTRFDHSFNDAASSRTLLSTIAPFQEAAMRERGNAWVFAADEFYRNAYRDDLLANLPSAEFYGDFSMFEDGIGIIRSTVDDWHRAETQGAIERATKALREHCLVARMIAGYAQKEFLDPLIAESSIGDCFVPLYVKNDYFGGNVDVTGLLTAQDIVKAIRATQAEEANRAATKGSSESGVACDQATTERGSGPGVACERFRSRILLQATQDMRARTSEQATPGPEPRPTGRKPIFLIPRVIFNDDKLTLDDKTMPEMEKEAATPLHMVSCSPIDYFDEIASIALEAE